MSMTNSEFFNDTVQSNGVIKYVCRINNPDSCGVACGFEQYGVYVGPGDPYTRLGLPNIPNFTLGPLAGSICDTLHTASAQQLFGVEVTAHPNPFGNELRVEATGISTKALLEVRDVLGKIHINAELSPINQTVRHTFDASLFPPGVYIVTLTVNGDRITRKVVKQ